MTAAYFFNCCVGNHGAILHQRGHNINNFNACDKNKFGVK